MKFTIGASLTFWLLMGLVCLLPSGFAQSVDPILLNRFFVEAPKAWNENQRFRERFPKKSRSWYRHFKQVGFGIYPNNNEVKNEAIESKFIGNQYSVHRVIDNEKKMETIFGKNPSYTFELNRPLGATQWIVVEIVQREKPGFDGEQDSYGAGGSTYNAVLLKHLEGVLLGPIESTDTGSFFNKTKKWLDFDRDEIVGIEEKNIDGRSCFIVKFLFTSQGIEPAETPGTIMYVDQWVSAEVVFVPEMQWNIARFEATLCRDKELRDVIVVEKIFTEYEPGFTGFVQPVRMTKERWNSSGKQTVKFEYSYATGLKSQQPSEFTVSAFGIPEPDWYRPPRPWRLYMSIVGLVLILTGAVLFRYGKNQWRTDAGKSRSKR